MYSERERVAKDIGDLTTENVAVDVQVLADTDLRLAQARGDRFCSGGVTHSQKFVLK